MKGLVHRRFAGKDSVRGDSLLSGFILGVLLYLGARELGPRELPGVNSPHLWALAGLMGTGLACGRARGLLWAAGAVECAFLLVIGYSPLAPFLMRAWVRTDPIQPAAAVVSLSANVYPDGTPDANAQMRLLHAYELLGAGAAPRLVITRIAAPFPSMLPAVRRQVRQLGLHGSIDEVGPVRNTHDEALAVARLARRRGWNRLILVSEPAHLRRAGAVFARAGLSVCCSPCASPDYHLARLDPPFDRLHAFRDWLHEAIGYEIYRWRGWI